MKLTKEGIEGLSEDSLRELDLELTGNLEIIRDSLEKQTNERLLIQLKKICTGKYFKRENVYLKFLEVRDATSCYVLKDATSCYVLKVRTEDSNVAILKSFMPYGFLEEEITREEFDEAFEKALLAINKLKEESCQKRMEIGDV